MNTQTLVAAQLNSPQARKALRGTKSLVAGYLAISVLTLAAIVVLRDNAAIVTSAVWVRSSIVVASAALMYSFAVRTARGSRGAYRRLRLVSATMVVAIAVIIAVPGAFPVWLKIEQGVCGAILLGVVLIVNGGHLRALFAAKSATQ